MTRAPQLAARATRMPCVPAGARQATLNLNSIHGGLAESGDDALPAPVVADILTLDGLPVLAFKLA